MDEEQMPRLLKFMSYAFVLAFVVLTVLLNYRVWSDFILNLMN